MKRVLFIDRDGTLVKEPKEDLQLDSLEKLEFVPGVFKYMGLISEKMDFELSMVTNQDGLGTDSFPEGTFWPAHNKMLDAFIGEGVFFDKFFIDRSFPADNAETRKPRTGMLTEYINNDDYDIPSSFVIGDRLTDIELAKNLGCKAILFQEKEAGQAMINESGFADSCVLITDSWNDIYEYLLAGERTSKIVRTTNETDILIELNLDGSGKGNMSTGLHFFDHMLDQIAKHSGCDLTIKVNGDLEVDEHHTIEDTAIALGEAFLEALGNKRGIERYGYCLPMDDCVVTTALDFGGRPWLVWEAEFNREMVGDMPTEMFLHFFKSFSDAAKANLYIKAEGQNEHHKIEGIFKALARSLKMAIKRDVFNFELPSTKGVL